MGNQRKRLQIRQNTLFGGRTKYGINYRHGFKRKNAHPIIDVCCGGRMWHFDKSDSRTVFMDNRKLETKLCDGRIFRVSPDIIGDFRNIPYKDATFSLVLFDRHI